MLLINQGVCYRRGGGSRGYVEGVYVMVCSLTRGVYGYMGLGVQGVYVGNAYVGW